MKNEDHSFKLLAVLIIAGVIAACLPSRPANSTANDKAALSHHLTGIDTDLSASAKKS